MNIKKNMSDNLLSKGKGYYYTLGLLEREEEEVGGVGGGGHFPLAVRIAVEADRRGWILSRI